MRIDPDLCRAILVAVEMDPGAGSGQGLNIAVAGFGPDVIAHHVKYLWDEELVKGIEATNLQSPYPEIMVLDITPKGRHYLDETEPGAPKRKMGFYADSVCSNASSAPSRFPALADCIAARPCNC